LGVQTTTSASIYFSPATTRFIPTTAIQDIFIHEAFKGFEVRFYLAIVVEGEEDVVVIFPVCGMKFYIYCTNTAQNLLPGRDILEEVWRGAKQCLYEPKS
jgi:phosphatidylinositol glycan class H protein